MDSNRLKSLKIGLYHSISGNLKKIEAERRQIIVIIR